MLMHFFKMHKRDMFASRTGGHGGPPLQQIVSAFKSYTTHVYGKKLWQRSFYDHVIRNADDMLAHLEYIKNNPLKWADDKYYTNV